MIFLQTWLLFFLITMPYLINAMDKFQVKPMEYPGDLKKLIFAPNKKQRNNNLTQILFAIGQGNEQLVDTLLKEKKSCINMPCDQDNNTLLMHAAQRGQQQAVNLLLQHQADLHKQNIYGNTALMIAAAHNQKDIIKSLLNHTKKLDIKQNATTDDNNQAPTSNAVKILEALNHNGDSAICLAASEDVLWLLINFAVECGLLDKQIQEDLILFDNISHCDSQTMCWLLCYQKSCYKVLAAKQRLDNINNHESCICCIF